MPRTKVPAHPPTVHATSASQSELKDRLRAMKGVADRFSAWKPAGQVLTKVKAHQTIFPLVDRATGVGGWPIQRIALVHGPSNHGKTLLAHGLGLSFLNAVNFYAFVDAEFTTPISWLSTLMAAQSSSPCFIAQRPRTYEETVGGVRELAEGIADSKSKGEIPADATGLVVVDSIRKLVPKGLLEKMLKGEGGLDGASGRGAMMKAALNSQWMDELIPTMYYANLSMLIISREYESTPEPGRMGMKLQDAGGGVDFKVGGGKSLVFDSSLVCRVTRGWVLDKPAKELGEVSGAEAEKNIIGERHTVTITKTKVSGKQGKTTKGYFHTSNGRVAPEGFDRARDVLELAIDAGKVVKAGSWLQCPTLGENWQGMNNAVKALTADTGLVDTLEGEARSTLSVQEDV